METFLGKLNLSEFAIEIYIKLLNRFPLTYYELHSVVPKVTLEEFNKIINELLNVGLITQQPSKNEVPITQYIALPPIFPILNYYSNINANLDDIKNSIQELMINSVNETFKENKTIELDSILQTFQEIKKDIDEDSIIQKQEVEDIVGNMEELNLLKQNLTIFYQKIVSITQTKFADLIKTINLLKTDIIERIQIMEFKKHKDEIISVIENQFKERLDKIIKDFPNTLQELIDKEFKKTEKPIENSADLIIQYQNDFKMLLLNLLSNFETEMNKIHNLLIENNENLFGKMKNLEIKIAERLNSIIQESVNEVSNLNKPIENLMKNYLQEINKADIIQFNKIWTINSITKINESIQYLIKNSKNELIIIIPNLEKHLAIEQFEKINSDLKVKIASSEAHTNSMVKNLKNIKNIGYKTYQNEKLIALRSDNNIIIIGVIQDSVDSLDNFVGIGTSFNPLIKVLDSIIQKLWEKAYSDTFLGTRMAKTQASAEGAPSMKFTTVKPLLSKKIKPEQEVNKAVQIEDKATKGKVDIPSQIHEITKEDVRSTQKQAAMTPRASSTIPTITDLKQKLKQTIDFVSIAKPKAGDEAGIQINNAFTNLVNQLDNIKGDKFGQELSNIADLILEKKGFSVTLHKIRSIIDKYKEKLSLLNNDEKKEIIEEIQSWKKKLF